MKLQNVFMNYYRYIESKKNKNKTLARIFNNIGTCYFNLILGETTYWYETTYWKVPAYVHNNIKKYMLKTYNAKYLYDYVKEQ